MNKQINIALLVGAAFAAGLLINLNSDSVGEQPTDVKNTQAAKEPLYWVAPMDPNFKRDKPGKSPMGMDLVPVYEESNASATPGTIRISPDVVNNLGVRLATVERKALKNIINTVGYVQYDEDKLVHIHPRVDGWLEKLYIKAEGEEVSKGQPLYDIYSPALVNAQEELLMALQRSNKRLINAAESRLAALKIPASTVAELKKSRQVKQYVTIFAEADGVVDNLQVREGFYVKPGNTLMSIGNLDQVWVTAEVYERQAAQVSIGDKVAMSLGYTPGVSWAGEVDYIYPTLDPKTRTVRLRMRFANNNHQLKPNMFANVSIVSQIDQQTLVIPREALIRTGTMNKVVLALGEGQFKSVKVQIGRTTDTNIEILDGLLAGDKVVTSAQFLLDSESSISSDFNRMSHNSEQPQSVWVEATIDNVMQGHKMLTVTHQPVDVWDWPVMTMDLFVGEQVDLNPLYEGLVVHIEMTKEGDNSYLISAVHIPDSAMAMSDMDHSTMDHSTMDHSAMAATQQSNTEAQAVKTASVNGVVNHIDVETAVINISREAITQWNRPAATMDFILTEELSLAGIEAGTEVHFTFMITDDFDFIVTDIAPLTTPSSAPASDHKEH
jgi:Cu(I)/Ag(I) efflux system membrane fusion protein